MPKKQSKDSNELKILLKKREVILNKQSLFKAQLDAFSEVLAENPIISIDSKVISELELRCERQMNLLKEYEDVQVSVECLREEEIQVDDRESFETEFYKVTSLCKNYIANWYEEKNHEQYTKLNQNNSSNLASVVQPAPLSNFQQNIKLPQIQLPKFSGSYENWLEFRDTFDSMINKNSSISQIQKFHYLRAALEGGAAQIIRSLEFSAGNYSVAWQALLNRYNNDSLLVHNHIKAIFGINSLVKESAFELRKMLDVLTKHLMSLDSLGQPVEHWDTLIIHILCGKLDKGTGREWEEHKSKETKDQSKLPTLEEFKKFIKCKADLLETLSFSKKDDIPDKSEKYKTHKSSAWVTFQSKQGNKVLCAFCNQPGHYIQNCAKFITISTKERIEQAKKLKLCTNCLRGNHLQKYCYAGNCKKCPDKHNTLLHLESEKTSGKTSDPSTDNHHTPTTSKEDRSQSSGKLNIYKVTNYLTSKNVLLSTALIQVKDVIGNVHICRVLLDSGSQSHFMTEQLCKKLGLPKTRIKMSVAGINQVESNIDYQCTVSVESLHTSWKTALTCLLLPIINEFLPNKSFDTSWLNIPSNIKLADPDFSTCGSIDMIIGAALFYNLLCIGQFSLGENLPTLQKTSLGWIVSGPINIFGHTPSQSKCHFSTTNQDLLEMIQKFWLIEEPAHKKPILSKEEELCEEIFVKTTQRLENGRFVVQMPLKVSRTSLGASKGIAMKRLRSLEAKFSKNLGFQNLYCDFLEEYVQLGHMSKVDRDEKGENESGYFLPHHGIVNEKSQTTKLRVVFDASAKTESGLSLNDIQCVGPTIQNDLMTILLGFRKHNIVICADIVKMYRQIQIDPEQRELQKIVWKDSSGNVQTYQLNTVTYGTASAPWLACRCLKQLAIDHTNLFPKASNIIQNDFYMDDVLTGCDTEEEAILLCDQISQILQAGCFELQKWASNSQIVLTHVKATNSKTILKLGENERMKTLGLYWSCPTDNLLYCIGNFDLSKPITKRSILSDISQVFDPLGLVSPCIIIGKIILQQLWLQKLNWDEALPSHLHTKWFNFRQELPHLNSLEIPRSILCYQPEKIELHAFCDSSSEAYGSCIYIRSVDVAGNIQVRLLCGKSRVAPLKSLTIPKLELCGALLLAQLVEKIKTALQIKFDNYFFWSDSTICISWIQTQPNILKPFVQNRVAQIQALTNPNDWYHIKTKENPADLVSRGVMPCDLLESGLWWSGPSWLVRSHSVWPITPLDPEVTIPEKKDPKIIANVVTMLDPFPMMNFSNFSRLKRVTAYVLRFIKNCHHSKQRKYGSLETSELQDALWSLVKISQRESFAEEILNLKNSKPISNKSKLLCLNPFLDENQILRVGGRLQHSSFAYEKKFPAVMSNKHHLTKLIFRAEHQKLMHCGAQHLLFAVREKFWAINGKCLARQIIHTCVRCFRAKPSQKAPLMGSLPADRVCPAPAFSSTGVDYAGPITIKNKPGRGARTAKAYICLFICLSTRSLHIELVSDLTKDCFIAAFRRFCARRGLPAKVYSDNGKTFVGARSELATLARFIEINRADLKSSFSESGVDWHFIPSYSPHMGGIWEAGVKSAKGHLKRAMGNAVLTFEELATVLTEIESILNSRPITPLSCDPNDFSALTPSHFLIGRPTITPPDPDLIDVPISRLSRYQYLQQLQQQFWKRWSREYISELQMRTKWKANNHYLHEGDLVVIKDDPTPPLQWKLGRIVSLHLGQDGIARVANVQTSAGVIKRSFAKICVLPKEV